jgi:DNA polymerase III alpha subunit (gram-positive type)
MNIIVTILASVTAIGIIAVIIVHYRCQKCRAFFSMSEESKVISSDSASDTIRTTRKCRKCNFEVQTIDKIINAN